MLYNLLKISNSKGIKFKSSQNISVKMWLARIKLYSGFSMLSMNSNRIKIVTLTERKNGFY